MVSSNGGQSFTPATISAAPYAVLEPRGVEDISCPTASRCYALTWQSAGNDVYESGDGGLTWRFQAVAPGLDLWALTCTDIFGCVAVGSDESAVRKGPIKQLLFPGASLATTDGFAVQSGRHFPVLSSNTFRGAVPANSWGLTDVACLAVRCYAVGTAHHSGPGSLIVSADFGRTWSPRALPGGRLGPVVDAVSCPTVRECVVGGSGERNRWSHPPRGYQGVIVTEDAGASWFFERVPPRGADINTVACATEAFCVATAYGPMLRGGAEVLVRR